MRRHERDVCGEGRSVPTAVALHQTELRTIKVPVLLVFAEHSVFPNPERERELYDPEGDEPERVKHVEIEGASHALMLQRGVAPRFRAIVSEWLGDRGF